MNRRLLVFALLIIGLGASLFVASQRMRVESQNKAFEVVVDYDEIQQIAGATGKTPVDVMKEFKRAGATSVAITQETFADAVSDGYLTPLGESRYQAPGSRVNGLIDALRQDLPAIANRLANYKIANGDELVQFSLPVESKYLSLLPMGFPEGALAQAKESGLIPVARLVNYPGATPTSIDAELKQVKSDGIDTVIFFGDQVLGYRGALNSTAKSIKNNNLSVGWVEFSKQKGDQKLAEKSKDSLIVVHSIAGDEMPKLDKNSVVDRFQKAVRERGVRMCYVRMFELTSPNVIRNNTNYISSITKAIEKANYVRKEVHPTGEVQVSSVVRALAAVGVAAGTMLLVLSLFDLSAGAMLWWTLALVMVCAGLAGSAEIGRKAVALLSAMVFPTLAVINAVKPASESPTSTLNLLIRTMGRFLMAVLTVAAGGMMIVGLVSQRSFMLRIDTFAGVKLAHLMPVLILAAVYAGGIAWKSDTWARQKDLLVRKVKEISANPILIWQAAAVLVVMVLVGLMVARSGNDSGVGVSPLELKFRSLLDKYLYVRPRTKEFLIGYPALILAIALALRGKKQWAAPLAVIGSIGVVSALNTFCHIHTPLVLSLGRVFNGTWVGGLIGLVLVLIVLRRRGK